MTEAVPIEPSRPPLVCGNRVKMVLLIDSFHFNGMHGTVTEISDLDDEISAPSETDTYIVDIDIVGERKFRGKNLVLVSSKENEEKDSKFGDEDLEECPICMEETRGVRVLPHKSSSGLNISSHRACQSCQAAMLQRNQSCPWCREGVLWRNVYGFLDALKTRIGKANSADELANLMSAWQQYEMTRSRDDVLLFAADMAQDVALARCLDKAFESDPDWLRDSIGLWCRFHAMIVDGELEVETEQEQEQEHDRDHDHHDHDREQESETESEGEGESDDENECGGDVEHEYKRERLPVRLEPLSPRTTEAAAGNIVAADDDHGGSNSNNNSSSDTSDSRSCSDSGRVAINLTDAARLHRCVQTTLNNFDSDGGKGPDQGGAMYAQLCVAVLCAQMSGLSTSALVTICKRVGRALLRKWKYQKSRVRSHLPEEYVLATSVLVWGRQRTDLVWKHFFD